MKKLMEVLSLLIATVAPSLKKSDSKVGIKETKEALVGVNEVSLALMIQFKDGVQATDFPELYAKIVADKEFEAKVKAAYDNYKAIPEEVKDLDPGEALELAGVQLEYVPKFVEVFGAEIKE
jgi:hypothetical protein